MENSNYFYQPGDSLTLNMRVNHRGRYFVNGLYLRFREIPGDSTSICSEAVTGIAVCGALSSTIFRVAIHVYFRYIENGVIEGDWQYIGATVRSAAIISTDYVIPRSAQLQIKLVRKGKTTENPVELQCIRLQGNFIADTKPTPTLDASMFSLINDQEKTTDLENNLFKKLYFRGIVPNYITRGANLSKQEDGDYISLFSTVARFFAIIMRFFKRWENASTDSEILKEILRNNGIQFDEINITADELQLMTQNLYNEISKRGTKEIFRKRGDIRPDETEVKADGELMRLIRTDNATEVLYETIPNYECGWCLGKSSPMYRGISNDCLALDKMDYADKTSHKFSSQDDVDKIMHFGYMYLVNDSTIPDGVNSDVNYQVLRWSGACGFGRIDNINPNDYLMKVDAHLDYEIVFGFKCVNNSGDAVLRASVEGFSINHVKYSDAFILPDKTTLTSDFFYHEESIPLNEFQPNKWYYIRFIIKAYGSEQQSSYILNIGRGNELHFNNAFIRYILPTIQITGGAISVCNYHIRPLVRGTNINCIANEANEKCFSLGFLRTNKIFHLYLRNRNTTVTKDYVEDYINRYLLPYSSANILTFIE